MKPYESKKSQFTRNLIRRRHAEWSEKTFGNVGPIGPLKHLSKEALEAAADPGDLSEWADMQFLLWDAQRRAGIAGIENAARRVPRRQRRIADGNWHKPAAATLAPESWAGRHAR